ncbi:MAG: CRISPR-associated endoribonuclease Cas6, partial [Bacilli bacterium]|nr:CRISPR-associated endoribonuclease Cas6 [Bacilli bacterium]
SVDDFDIVPLKNKKTVVKLYHHSMNASLGIFQLKGNPELLDFLWKAGIGSHRSSGFGSFKILK